MGQAGFTPRVIIPIVQRPFLASVNKGSIFNAEDLMVDIGHDKPNYRGSLIIVPTPIGNLGDLSVR